MINAYSKLLNDKAKMWSSMVAVVTKVGWKDDDYSDIDHWKQDMQSWGQNLEREFSNRYDGAKPIVQVISQDISLKKRKENIPGTEQYVLMQKEMEKLYNIAYRKHQSGDY